MKYMLVFALFLVTVYCYPWGKHSPKRGHFPKHGIKDFHRKYYPRYPSWVWKNCKKQPTLSTITRTPKVPVTTANTSQKLPTTAVATQYKTSPFMTTIEKLSTPDNAGFTRGDN